MISTLLWLDWTTNFPIVAFHSLNIGQPPLKNFVLEETTDGESAGGGSDSEMAA